MTGPVSLLSAWWLLLIAIPVVLFGEWLCRRVGVLARFSIPAPVAGALAVSAVFLACNLTGWHPIAFQTKTGAGWWTWLTTPDVEWGSRPERNINLPLLIGFFTCVGLNVTWRLVKAGSWQVPVLLGLASVLALFQNFVGVGVAYLLKVPPLLGLVCGSVSLTGGHGNALGFAGAFEQAGLSSAATLGAAAATFGLVAGSMMGGPVASFLIKRNRLRSIALPDAEANPGEPVPAPPHGIIADLRQLSSPGTQTLGHVLLLLGCIKAGAWISYLFQRAGILFPAYMGALLLGVVIRNLVELTGRRWISSTVVDRLGSVMLAIFLAVAMTGLNLRELTAMGGPMLIILAAQLPLMALFAIFVTYRCLGRDYEAAVMAAGHCGFGLGATPNAIANMDALVKRYGPAPRAYTVVPPIGAFLIDFTNAIVITSFLNFLA